MPDNSNRWKKFIKKETLTQVFSCEFCEISENTFFHRTPLVTASVVSFCFFLSNAFFLTQPQCCLTNSWIELQMYHTERLLIFAILVSMSRCGVFMSSLYDLFFIFIFFFTNILLLLLIFRICSIIFWMRAWITNVNNFQI